MSAELSIVLPTDNYETVRAVLEHVRRQTIVDRLEVILVVPDEAEIPETSTFVRQKIVRVRSTSSFAAARAAGISAATASYIFMAETHSYLRPDAAEKMLMAARSGDWSIVLPGFENANPRRVLSWASFLVDYGRWTPISPAGETRDVPLFNALFRRSNLPQTSADLARAISHGDEILLIMRAQNARIYFEPAARIAHLNLDFLASSFHEQFLAGAMIGRQRAERWSLFKRLAYLLASPLIPFVLFRRNFLGAWRTIRARQLSWFTLPAMFVLYIGKALGELLGYAGLTSARQAAAMDRYEIRKRDYVRRKEFISV